MVGKSGAMFVLPINTVAVMGNSCKFGFVKTTSTLSDIAPAANPPA